MPMLEFTWCQVQLLSYLKDGYLRRTIEVPMVQEKSEQIFFVQPKVHQNKFADLNKAVPTNPLKMIVSLSSVKQLTRRLAILRRLPRTTSSQRKRKWLSFLPRVAMNQATISIVVINIATTIKATNVTTTIANPTILIKMTNATMPLTRQQ
jgi:hypothetical protein